MKQLQSKAAVPSQVQVSLVERIEYARQQMHSGDFAGCISICEPLLNSLPKHSEIYLEALSLTGLAHGMQQNYQESYDIFSEAVALDPTRAEFWHNHGLASSYMGRIAEAVRDYERAVELSKNDTSEMAYRFALELEEGCQRLQEAMATHEADITLEEYTKREESFSQGVRLMKQKKWSEAELIFRQLTSTGSRVPAYWGNLGVCLTMQIRYDGAEEAFKQALAIDPNYPIARDNLKWLPDIRRSKKPIEVQTRNTSKGDDITQSLAFYKKDEQGETTFRVVIEKVGNTTKSTWKPMGKQNPRYDFFLNPYQDTRFTICPRCEIKTRPRKFTLAVNVHPAHTVIVDKICRFCHVCGLLIVHQDQLEDILATNLMETNPEVIGNDYQVMGTLDRTEWNRNKQEPLALEQLVKYLHDFRETIGFERITRQA
jgi:Flp pilus assembly protein TadD